MDKAARILPIPMTSASYPESKLMDDLLDTISHQFSLAQDSTSIDKNSNGYMQDKFYALQRVCISNVSWHAIA